MECIYEEPWHFWVVTEEVENSNSQGILSHWVWGGLVDSMAVRQGKGQAVQEYQNWNTKQNKGFHKQAIILGISIEEHQSLMKDLSPLATGNHFQATRRDLLLNDRKVSSSSWHSLVQLGRSTWLIAQQNSCLANDSTYASAIYTLYFEVWIT